MTTLQEIKERDIDDADNEITDITKLKEDLAFVMMRIIRYSECNINCFAPEEIKSACDCFDEVFSDLFHKRAKHFESLGSHEVPKLEQLVRKLREKRP